jgi:hypothetical protein
LEQRLGVRLDQLASVTLPKSRVVVNTIDASSVPVVARANEFFYCGKYWCVPESFQFPCEIYRLNGWRMWLCGIVAMSSNVAYKIKPFHSFLS